MNRLLNYIKDTRAELKHVSWPTTHQAVIYTALVIGITVMVSAIVGVFDFLFTRLLNMVI